MVSESVIPAEAVEAAGDAGEPTDAEKLSAQLAGMHRLMKAREDRKSVV